MEEELRTQLEDLLISLDAHADETVLEYVTGVLAEYALGADGGDEDRAEHLEHLDQLLEGGCEGGYVAAPAEVRRERLAAIADGAATRHAVGAGPSSGPPPTSQAPAAAALAGDLHGLRLERASSSSGSSSSSSGSDSCDATGSGGRGRGSSGGSDAAPAAVPAAVHELSALCSGRLSLGFLQYALEWKFDGSLEATALFLLDSDARELAASEAEWQQLSLRQEREQAQAELLQVRNKQQILQKFDLRPVPELKDPRKPGSKIEPVLITRKGKESKVRYLDGRVVSHKGEKFIIEKTGEEWDGGSRGKVFTKGKRGKGFT